MAAKRIAQSSINWTAMAERVPAEQKVFYNALKGRSDAFLRAVLSNPEAAPKIDFAAYKGKIPVAGLVDNFQKAYENLKVPYPVDTKNLIGQINDQQKKQEADSAHFIAESKKRVKEHEEGLAKWAAMLPYDQMTMEDFRDAHPDDALDPINRPTFWPHTPEEQLDYKDPEAGVQEAKH